MGVPISGIARCCGAGFQPADPRTATKITGSPNTIRRAGPSKELLLNASRGAVRNLAAHRDCRGTRHDHHDPADATHPSDSAIRSVADKSDDKKPDAVPDTPQAAGNTPAVNNTAAAEEGISPVPESGYKLANSLQAGAYSKGAAVVQTPEPVRKRAMKIRKQSAHPPAPAPPQQAWPQSRPPASQVSIPPLYRPDTELNFART